MSGLNMEKVKGQKVEWCHGGMKRDLMTMEGLENGKGISSQESFNFLYYIKWKKIHKQISTKSILIFSTLGWVRSNICTLIMRSWNIFNPPVHRNGAIQLSMLPIRRLTAYSWSKFCSQFILRFLQRVTYDITFILISFCFH